MENDTSKNIAERLIDLNADEFDYLDFLIGVSKYDTFDDGTILYHDFMTIL